MGEAARIWTTVGANLAPLKAGLAEAGAATSRFGSSFGSALANHTKQMEKFGRSWSSHVTLPLLATGAAAAKMSMDFQRNMALISTSAGGSARDVKILAGQVLALARVSPYGPNELVKALYHLKSLGYDNATAMRTLRVAIGGAMTGQSDLESTTSALGAAIRTNIKGTGDFSKAMATLNAIVGAGNMRMDELIGALGTGILPAAKSAGLSLKDVGAALALMVDEGMHADNAATRLRMAFTMMEAPSGKANEALGKIGLSGSKLALVMQGPTGLIGGLQLLRNHLQTLGGSQEIARWAAQVDRGKMSLEQFTELASKTAQFQVVSDAFGGARSGAAITMLLNNLDVLKQKMVQINGTIDGYKQKVEEARQLDVNKLKTAWSSVEVSLIKAGAAITPFVVRASQGLAVLSDWFSRLSVGQQRWLAGPALVGGPMLIFAAKLIRLLQTVKGLYVAEAAASTTATRTVVAGQAEQAAAIETTSVKLTRFGTMLRGLAGMAPILIPIVLMISEKGAIDSAVSNFLDSHGLGFLGGKNQVKSFQQYQGLPDWAKTQLQQKGLTQKQILNLPGAPKNVGQGEMRGASAASSYYAARTRAQAAAREAAMRSALEKKANAQFSKLWNSTYGGPDYSPPGGLDGAAGLSKSGSKSGSKAAKKPVLNPALSAILAAASKYGLDPAAMAAVAIHESGLNPMKVGDYGTSFGLFQLHKGGALPAGMSAAQTKNPYLNALVAARGIAAAGGRGLTGTAAINLIARKFERPANPSAEVGDAIGQYAAMLKLLQGGTPQSMAKLFPGFASIKLADPGQVNAQAALFKKLLKESGGLDPATQAQVKGSLRAIGKSLVQVVTPQDLSVVKTKLAGVKTIISQATAAMVKVVDAKKQAFSTAWSRIAQSGMDQLDKQLQTKLDKIDADLAARLKGIEAKYRSGPAEDKLAAMEEAHNQEGLQRDLSDAKQKLADAQGQLAKLTAIGVGNKDANGNTVSASDLASANQAVTDAQQQLADAQYAIQLDAAQKAADLEQKSNDESRQREEDAAQKDADAQRAALQDQYDRLKQAFQDQADAIAAGLESGAISAATGLSQITGLFTQFGVDLQGQGPVIAGTIYNTITAGLAEATQQADDLADALRALAILKGQSASAGSTPGGRSPGGRSLGGAGNGLGGAYASDTTTATTDTTTATTDTTTTTSTGRARGIGRVIAMAAGGAGRVTKPTLFLAGEKGIEDYAFSGGGKTFDRGAPVILNVTGNYLLGSDREMARQLADIVEPHITRRRVSLGV